MISYPRWKIALVAVVLLIGIFLALPNLFGEENALQLARDRAAVLETDTHHDTATARRTKEWLRMARSSIRAA